MIDKRDTPEMFSAIAGRYDTLNHILSFNIDRGWRRKLVRAAGVMAGASVLDVATGTGDVAVGFAGHTPAGRIVGIDRSSGMLEVAHDTRVLRRRRRVIFEGVPMVPSNGASCRRAGHIGFGRGVRLSRVVHNGVFIARKGLWCFRKCRAWRPAADKSLRGYFLYLRRCQAGLTGPVISVARFVQ